MEFELATFLIVCPLVFLAGFVDAIAGGGGLIALPAYILAGVPIHNAIATNKLSSVLGTLVSTFRFWKNNYVDILFILPSVAAAIVGSAIGANLALMVQERYLQYLLVIVLPVTAYYVFKNKSYDKPSINAVPRKTAAIFAAIISFVVGGYDGFYGPGTGTFLILLYMAVCRIDVRRAAGNAKLVNLASNFAAFVTFLISGKILVVLGLTAALFSIAGNYLGAGLAMKRGYRIVRPIVLAVLTLLFVKIVVG